jgi:hypothetical protein
MRELGSVRWRQVLGVDRTVVRHVVGPTSTKRDKGPGGSKIKSTFGKKLEKAKIVQ